MWQRLNRLYREERGITGLETAIILIAFVVVASVFAYVVLSAGFLAADQAKGTIIDGMDKVAASLEVRGSVIAERGYRSVTGGTTIPALGTGVVTSFKLDPFGVAAPPDIILVADSETVYVAGTAKKRVTDYTINNNTGVITFITAPANLAAITANYSYYGVVGEVVGVGNGTTTTFNLRHFPVVVTATPSQADKIFLNAVLQTTGYTLTAATGAIVFATAPGADVVITATYAYTTVTATQNNRIDYVKFVVAPAVTGKSVNMTPPSVGGTTNRTVISYHDNDERDDKITNWTVTNLGSNNGDNVLESGEQMEVRIDLNSERLTLGANTEFTIEIRAPQGGVVAIERGTPAALLSVNDLN